MRQRVQEMSFVIGIFFLLVALILLAGGMFSPALRHPYNQVAGWVFLVFGAGMAFLRKRDRKERSG